MRRSSRCGLFVLTNPVGRSVEIQWALIAVGTRHPQRGNVTAFYGESEGESGPVRGKRTVEQIRYEVLQKLRLINAKPVVSRLSLHSVYSET